MRVVVTADTHLRRDWPNRRLPAAAEPGWHRTIGVLELDDGQIVDHRIEVVDD